MKPRVTNICVSFRCDSKLNLQEIYNEEEKLQTPIRYNLKKFPGLRVRLLVSKTTALIFASGYIGIVGSRSETIAKQSAEEVLQILNKYESNAKITNYKINNICGALTLNPLNLTSLASKYPLISSYETELFPALKFNFENKIFTIHHTGKIFSTGFKSVEEMNLIFNKLCPLLFPFYLIRIDNSQNNKTINGNVN